MSVAAGVHCAVLGDPVEHSLSPVLHRAAYAHLGLADWSYDARRVPAGTLPTFLDGLGPDWRGLSLTMPLKRELLALATERGWQVSGRARAAGGANTLVRDGEGWRGDNTDLPGAVAAVRERYTGPVERVLVVGGGATAASIGLALCDLGAREVVLLVRSVERAQEAVDVVAAHASTPSVRAVLEVPGEADVLVSTVPADAQDPALLARSGAGLLFEALYDPWPTPLAAAALDAGVPLVSGLDLLVHQAVLQVEQFTGHPVPVEVLRAAGEAALAARGRG
jgi:shikimate dehydrogenase